MWLDNRVVSRTLMRAVCIVAALLNACRGNSRDLELQPKHPNEDFCRGKTALAYRIGRDNGAPVMGRVVPPPGPIRHEVINCSSGPLWMNARFRIAASDRGVSAEAIQRAVNPDGTPARQLSESGYLHSFSFRSEACIARSEYYRKIDRFESVSAWSWPPDCFEVGWTFRLSAVFHDKNAAAPVPPTGVEFNRGPISSNELAFVCTELSGIP